MCSFWKTRLLILIVAGSGLGGSAMRTGANYSTWWNGGLRTIPYFHNMIGLLTEIIGDPTPMQVSLVASKQLPSGDWPLPVAPQTWHYRQSIDYEMENNRAVLDDAAPGNACHITFKSDAGGIDVVLGQADECRYYCGMRASFDGRYLVPASGCRNSERKAAQGRFARLYGAKDYQGAFAALQPVLSDCAPTLFWFEEAQIRNDLSVTLYHLGRKDACVAVLKPTIDAHGTSEEALRDELPPSDFEGFLPLAKAAWHNAKLCSQK